MKNDWMVKDTQALLRSGMSPEEAADKMVAVVTQSLVAWRKEQDLLTQR